MSGTPSKIKASSVNVGIRADIVMSLDEYLKSRRTIPISLFQLESESDAISLGIEYLASKEGGFLEAPPTTEVSTPLLIRVMRDKNGAMQNTFITTKYRYPLNDETRPYTGEAWQVGDVVYNNDLSTYSCLGWVCTVSGVPGAWKRFATISNWASEFEVVEALPEASVLQYGRRLILSTTGIEYTCVLRNSSYVWVNDIGDVSELATTDKATLVSAVNELKSDLDAVVDSNALVSTLYRQNSTAYSLGDVVDGSEGMGLGYSLVCTTAGTTASTKIATYTGIGTTLTDGTVKWLVCGKKKAFDRFTSDASTFLPSSSIHGIGYEYPSTVISLMDSRALADSDYNSVIKVGSNSLTYTLGAAGSVGRTLTFSCSQYGIALAVSGCSILDSSNTTLTAYTIPVGTTLVLVATSTSVWSIISAEYATTSDAVNAVNTYKVLTPSKIKDILKSIRLNSEVVALGDIRKHSTTLSSNLCLECITSGTTAVSEPTWTEAGTSIIDGTAVWYIHDIRSGLATNRVQALGTISTATMVSVASGSIVTATLGSALSIALSASATTCKTVKLVLTNGGAYTITWDTSIKWVGGTEPALSASGVDVLSFVTPDNGTTWYGTLLGSAFA